MHGVREFGSCARKVQIYRIGILVDYPEHLDLVRFGSRCKHRISRLPPQPRRQKSAERPPDRAEDDANRHSSRSSDQPKSCAEFSTSGGTSNVTPYASRGTGNTPDKVLESFRFFFADP
jgi:hypothetical protein